jgi:hypothetical protein
VHRKNWWLAALISSTVQAIAPSATASAASPGPSSRTARRVAPRVGVPDDLDLALGLLAIIICFEVTRRTTGWPLVIVGVTALAYALYGDNLPGLLRHSGYSLNRIINTQYMALDGIFGILLRSVHSNFQHPDQDRPGVRDQSVSCLLVALLNSLHQRSIIH